ncbi:MAG: queuosine precursor transporter [Bacilli bacterium]|nr:queuosine precursor transporter [Bacilli bacterium]
MNSLYLLIIELIICIISIIIFYKNYKLVGLYAYTIASIILSCMMSFKMITVYNYDMNLGIIPLVTTFIVANIIIQKIGPEETKKHLLLTVIVLTVSYIILLLIKMMSASKIGLFTSASYNNIFDNSLRIIFANIVTILYSLILNNKLYYYLKRMKNNIIISNIFSTIIIQFISSILFGIIAYTFIKEPIDIIKIIMIRYLMSLVVGLAGTVAIITTKYIKEQ